MGKSLTEAAKAVLMNENANAATLKPGASGGEKIGPGASAKIADAPVEVNGADGKNVGAAAAVKPEQKDKQKASAKPGMPMQGITAAPETNLQEDDAEEGDVVAEGSPAPKPVKKDMADAIAKFKGKITKVEPKTDKKGKLKMAAEEAETLEEDTEEDIEISEELAEFIDQMVAEGASEDEIAQAIEENFELVSEESDEDEDEEDDKEDKEDDDKKEKMDEEVKIDMTEHVDALLAGEELSEEFKAKATTIFEAAVKTKIEEEKAKLEAAYEAKLNEAVEAINEELSSSVDDYLNFVVEQWTKDNEVAIEAGLRTELTEDFISGLRELFAEHYIDIPEDKVNVIEEMGAKVEELEAKLNEEIERNVAMAKMLNESKSNEILIKACDGLTDTQAEKLKSLAEGIEYADVKEYEQKLSVIKESYFNKTPANDQVLDKVESSTDGKGVIQEELTGPMSAYVKVLGRTAAK
jgi:hypothetical protein